MRLKQEGNIEFYDYFKSGLLHFLRYAFGKKMKILFLFLIIFITFIIGTFSGLLILGFFGTLNEPSQRVLDIAHSLGIDNMRSFKFIFVDNILAENIKIPINYIKGQFSNTEKVYIDISFEDYRKLEYIREQALEKRILIRSLKEEEFVPATITYGNKKIRVGLRLKGDAEDHWNTDKWSFRIDVKGGDTLFSMKRFNIQHPKTRAYIYGWFVNSALEKEGIITPRFVFIDVTINGKDKGIYAIEESFDKILIENSGLREGPIIKFNEDLMWKRYLQGEDFKGILPDSYINAEIDSFQTNMVKNDPVKLRQYLKAKDLLEAFREGKLSTHDVFDIDKFAKYIAFIDVMGGYFGLSYNNMRFYYNPVTSLLEPIAYGLDNPTDIYTVSYGYENEGWYPIRDTLFADEIFTRKYFEELKRISEQEYLDNLFLSMDKETKKKLNIIHSEYPYIHFSRDIFYNNQVVIRNFLNPIKGLQAYIKNIDNNIITLEVANIQERPIEIISIEHKNQSYSLVQENNYLEQKSSNNQLVYKTFEFKLPQRIDPNNISDLTIKINYNLFGDSEIRSEDVFPWSHLYEEFLESDFIRKESNVRDFEFLEMDEINKKIYIKIGDWKLNKDLIIPKGFTVFGEGGTTLDLAGGSMILSYSNLEFIGNEKNQINIISSDKTGQGLTILNAKGWSRFEYVYFNSLTNPSKNDWELTGAITFYESPAIFKHVVIDGMNSEDSINIIRSEYGMTDVTIKNGLSDCMDNDFSKGKIKYLYINNCVNDALDFSGSFIEIENADLSNLGDKGISVGEKSIVNASNIKVENSYIGVASKDISVVYMDNVNLLKNRYGIAAYQKKPEFGPSNIIGKNVNMQDNKVDTFIEENSKLILNGKEIYGDQKKVYETFCLEGRC